MDLDEMIAAWGAGEDELMAEHKGIRQAARAGKLDDAYRWSIDTVQALRDRDFSRIDMDELINEIGSMNGSGAIVRQELIEGGCCGCRIQFVPSDRLYIRTSGTHPSGGR